MAEQKKGIMNWWLRNSLVGSIVTAIYGSDDWISNSKILSGAMKVFFYLIVVMVFIGLTSALFGG